MAGRTSSYDFPVSGAVQAYGGAADGLVTALDSTGTHILHSTFLGGADDDHARGLAVDANGSEHVAGQTHSNDFPTLNAFQPATGSPGDSDAFLVKLLP